jgi:predicted N-acetyltransferase YhbS
VRIIPALREFAEVPERFVEIPAGISLVRLSDERRCILRDVTWASIVGVRVAPDGIDDLVEEVRSLVPSDREPLWFIGPSSRPKDLLEELQKRGFVPPRRRASETRALALTTEPDGPDGPHVGRVETFEEFAAAREVAWEAFETPHAHRAREQLRLREEFDDMVRTGLPIHFIAYDHGRAAGSAAAVPSDRGVFLMGGAVAPWARGRGIYRALVLRRWEYAVRRGTPALVTHANPGTSYPILRRLGFEDVGTIRRLEDPGGRGEAR